MAQKKNVPDWIHNTVEDIRIALVKDGFGYEELGKMKMHIVYKLIFGKYKQGYIEWYRYEKLKNEKE